MNTEEVNDAKPKPLKAYGEEIGTATKDGKSFKVFDTGSTVIIADAAGIKVTHSDSREGLESAGYVLNVKERPAPPSGEELQDKIDQQAERIVELEDESANRQGQIDDLEAAKTELAGEIKDLKGTVKDLESEKEDALNKIKELEAELADAKTAKAEGSAA